MEADVLQQLKRSVKLHSYTYRNNEGELKLVILLNYIDPKGSVHRIANTEVTLEDKLHN